MAGTPKIIWGIGLTSNVFNDKSKDSRDNSYGISEKVKH